MPDFISRLVDQLNPLSAGNVTLYFITVLVYSYTAIAVWLARSAGWRFGCFLVNQLFSFGVFVSWTVAVVISVTYWPYALGTGGFGILLALGQRFARRRRSDQLTPRTDSGR